jgi:WD40 repeat protein
MRLNHLASLQGVYVTELSFAPDGETWGCARAGEIQLWRDTQTLHRIQTPSPADGPLRFANDGELLLAGPFLVSVREGRLVPLPPLGDRLGFGIDAGPLGPTQMVPQRAAFTPDAAALMVYGRYQPGQERGGAAYRGPQERLVLLEGRTREPRSVLWEGDGLLNCRALDTTERRLAAAGMGTRLWSLAPTRLLAEYPARRAQINALRFSADGHQLARGDAAGFIFLHSVEDGSVRDWLADPAGISSLCFSPDGARIVSGGMDGALTVWANRGEPRQLYAHRFDAPVEASALSPDACRLLVALGGRRPSVELYAVDDQGT